ncbi:hypothetical protein LEM8419_00020 [Neolewinella maritima]|uniref:DUF2987 domain-containing protein n=1 Tax=Neolewinella maritima TaxID=1383882 RepID=A0ABM9AWF5_9BACT|nr:hypothetical protein [Neolewinella maritima]CAH0998675.1 hypothetical protein LEM8419_00020 [Neolewinella maritima]
MLRATLLILFLLIGSASPLLAKRGESIFDRWSHMDQKTIELHLNLDSLEALRYSEAAIQGTVIDNGRSFTLAITTRGRFRRRTCALPPMKLQFDKDMLRLAGLNTHNDYKLVTPCTSDPAGQDAILREQLAYELYHTVAPEASFRTKLLTINYVNTADGSVTSGYAILIEDIDELESRLQADNCKECYNAPLAEYANAEQVALFQYMIGNHDFSTLLTRNLKLLRTADGRLTSVPYDFDFSGLVSPPYLNAKVKERHLIWEFTDTPDFTAATATLLSLEEQLLQQVEEYAALDKGSKRKISKYLRGFFQELQAGEVTL